MSNDSPTISPRNPKDYHPLEVENTKLRAINLSQIAEIARLNGIIRELETQAANVMRNLKG